MKVVFTETWSPYQKGEVLHITDAFWEANQMWRVAEAYDPAKHDKPVEAKQVDKPPADKMAKGQFSKNK